MRSQRLHCDWKYSDRRVRSGVMCSLRRGNIAGLLGQRETIMLRLGSAIRLTRREIERFTFVTGIEPVGIRTTDDLRAYVARCKAHYWGKSADTRYLHWLIDREVDRCKGERRAAS